MNNAKHLKASDGIRPDGTTNNNNNNKPIYPIDINFFDIRVYNYDG